MKNAQQICIILLLASLTACSTTNSPIANLDSKPISTERTNVDVGFYDIKAKTFKELDQQIRLHGPMVKGVGKAIASTNIKMIPDIRFQQAGESCQVLHSSIKVAAMVTLPRLKNANAKGSQITNAFDSLEEYARLHEAVHVSIADKYAQQAEQKIQALKPEPNCRRLETKAVRVFKAEMAAHEKEQLDFDRKENVRFSALTRR